MPPVKGKEQSRLRELIRCNDLVRMSFLSALLSDAGIPCLVFDDHASAVQGSLDILPRRLMVPTPQFALAQQILREAGELPELPGRNDETRR